MKTNPENSLQYLTATLPVLEKIAEWTEAEIHDKVFKYIEESGAKTGKIMYPMRVALSGKKSTPGGGVELAYLLGRKETLERMGFAIEGLKKHMASVN